MPSRKCLTMAGLKLDQIDVIEINERFAAVPARPASKSFCDRNKAKSERRSRRKTNINGSAMPSVIANTSFRCQNYDDLATS